MVSLKSLVSGISILLFFAPLIFDPQGLGASYVLLLSLLCPAAEQDYKTLAVSAEVNSIPRAEIDNILLQARPNAFRVGEISLRHPRNCHRHLGSGLCVQIVKPFSVRVLPSAARYSRTSITI